jgi:hypothetical protein
MNTIKICETVFGSVLLPDDFPMDAIRKDGWPDRRRKIADDLAEYFECLNEGALQIWQRGEQVHGIRALPWAEWLAK